MINFLTKIQVKLSMMRLVVVKNIINFIIVTPLSMKMPRKNNTSQKNILVIQEEKKQNKYKEGKF